MHVDFGNSGQRAGIALALCAAMWCITPAAAGSKRTELCVVNQLSETVIVGASVHDNKDWDGSSRPDKNFLQEAVAPGDSLCHREELNSAEKTALFDMVFRSGDTVLIGITSDQKNAETKYNRVLATNRDIQVYQGSGGDTNGLYIRPTNAPDGGAWMSALVQRKPDVSLYQIAMPASHDAGMYVANDCTPAAWPEWAKTQDRNVLNQLTAGSRYFDFRPFSHNGKIYVGHFMGHGEPIAQGCYGAELRDILLQVRTFLLSTGRFETIILKFSHTAGGPNSAVATSPSLQGNMEARKKLLDNLNSLQQGVVDMLENQDVLGGFLYRNGGRVQLANLKLAEAAGKVIAVFDCEFGRATNERKDFFFNQSGIFRYIDKDYKDNDWCKPVGYPSDDGLTVYDVYSGTKSLPQMIDDQLGKLKSDGGDNRGYLFLLSWTLTGGLGKADIEELSNVAKPWLPQTLTRIRKGWLKPANLIYYDFVDPWMGAEIIKLN